MYQCQLCGSDQMFVGVVVLSVIRVLARSLSSAQVHQPRYVRDCCAMRLLNDVSRRKSALWATSRSRCRGVDVEEPLYFTYCRGNYYLDTSTSTWRHTGSGRVGDPLSSPRCRRRRRRAAPLPEKAQPSASRPGGPNCDTPEHPMSAQMMRRSRGKTAERKLDR